MMFDYNIELSADWKLKGGLQLSTNEVPSGIPPQELPLQFHNSAIAIR